jgi:hypothetical protein
MRRPALIGLSTLTLLAATATAGCGSTAARRYEETGLDVTFEIPPRFSILHRMPVARTTGVPADTAAIGAGQGNRIVVSRYNLRVTATEENLPRIKPEIDAVVGQLAGRRVRGRRVEFGGLPGYEYRLTAPPVADRIVVLFRGGTEYLVRCGSTPKRRDDVAEACDAVLSSLRPV